MSLFQDKKLIIHVSLEIVTLGAMTYFFHTRAKSLELRVKSVEEQFSKEITILQDNIVQLKKQLKKSDSVIEEIKIMLKQTQQVQQIQQNQYKNSQIHIKSPSVSDKIDKSDKPQHSKVSPKAEFIRPIKQFPLQDKDYKNMFTTINLSSAVRTKSTATVELIDDDAVNDVVNDVVNDDVSDVVNDDANDVINDVNDVVNDVNDVNDVLNDDVNDLVNDDVNDKKKSNENKNEEDEEDEKDQEDDMEDIDKEIANELSELVS